MDSDGKLLDLQTEEKTLHPIKVHARDELCKFMLAERPNEPSPPLVKILSFLININ